MKRYKALMRDTWWAWAILLAFGLIFSNFSPIFYSTFPICIFAFFYFGMMRYDENGNGKEM